MQTTDPHSQNENLTNNINQLVYEFLFVRDKKLHLIPALANRVEAGQPDDLAVQAAPGRQVPRRHAVHRRRRRVQLRARALRHLAAQACTRTRPAFRRRSTTLPSSSRPTARTRSSSSTSVDQHHDQGLVREEPGDEAAELHAEGGHDHRASGQRHGAVHAEDARAGREDGPREEPELVGDQGRSLRGQRRRGDLHANRLRRDARGRADLGRGRPRQRPAAAGRATARRRRPASRCSRARRTGSCSSVSTSTATSSCTRASRARTRSRTSACDRRSIRRSTSMRSRRTRCAASRSRRARCCPRRCRRPRRSRSGCPTTRSARRSCSRRRAIRTASR